ncbi:MAG: alpha/beta hydrolase [Candidatus Hydrogenedentes bacterium]|nr:alpha/beta hydrolase [Candidatus Hydrogenedentota bacterium]
MRSQQLQSLIAMARARSVAPDASVVERRELFERAVAMFPLPPDVRVQPVDAGGVPSEWLSTPGIGPSAVLLFFHGGGYNVGSLNTHRHLAADLARAGGVRALSVGYRLAPEHPFPAAVDDAVTAYRWLLSNGIPPQRIILSGDSGGGGLALAALLKLKDDGETLPAAAVCLSPWTDLAITGASVVQKAADDPMLTPDELYRYAAGYLGGADHTNPLSSPLYGDLQGLPPLLIHVGTSEILLDDSLRFAERARNAGVPVTLTVEEDLIHVWHYFAQLIPEGEKSLKEVGAFVRGILIQQHQGV